MVFAVHPIVCGEAAWRETTVAVTVVDLSVDLPPSFSLVGSDAAMRDRAAFDRLYQARHDR